MHIRRLFFFSFSNVSFPTSRSKECFCTATEKVVFSFQSKLHFNQFFALLRNLQTQVHSQKFQLLSILKYLQIRHSRIKPVENKGTKLNPANYFFSCSTKVIEKLKIYKDQLYYQYAKKIQNKRTFVLQAITWQNFLV